MLIKIENTREFFNASIETLKKGGIIALPTDTIYGFGVDGTQIEAVKKLIAVKGRDKKPFTYFMSKNEIKKYAIITKRKIIDYFMPGPLTVILKKKEKISLPMISEKIGIRIPQTDFIIQLLNLYHKPLAVTSANISGQPPLNSAAEIAKKFTNIDVVINGGYILSQPSTVLDLTTTPPTIKRKGTIPILEIEKVYGKRVMLDDPLKFNLLFVCTANTCRSPMAEGIFKTLVNDQYCVVKSAGILPLNGQSAAQFSIEVVKEYGGSIVQHQTKGITKELIDWADLILVMEFKHYDAVLQISPDATIKTFLLKEYKKRVIYNRIADPIGKEIKAYREAAQEMLPSLKAVAQDIEKRYEKVEPNVK